MKLSLGWHKDKWLDIENIFISANDRGLKFGDGIFETILIKNNNAVLIDEHIQRLENSCRVLNMSCLLYTSPSPRDRTRSRMPSSA